MSELAFNLIRLGYLALLWVFVLFAVAVLRRDLTTRGRAARSSKAAAVASISAPANLPTNPALVGAPLPVGPMPGGTLQSGYAPVEAPLAGPYPGAPVPLPQPVPYQEPVAYQQPTPMIVVGPPRIPNRLVVSSGPLAGSELPLLNQPITIGRGANNTLVLEDDYASSKHACIYPTDDGWVVEDLNSTNGTFLDGAPLVGSAPMPLGARVTIGNSILELVS